MNCSFLRAIHSIITLITSCSYVYFYYCNHMTIYNNEYPVTDSVLKAILIDGLPTVALFSMPYIAPALLPKLVPLSISKIATYSIINTIASGWGYYVGAMALENEHGIYSYVESGATEYGAREIIKVRSLSALEVSLGAINHVAYELCNKIEVCREDPAVNTVVAMGVEGAEMVFRGMLDNSAAGQ